MKILMLLFFFCIHLNLYSTDVYLEKRSLTKAYENISNDQWSSSFGKTINYINENHPDSKTNVRYRSFGRTKVIFWENYRFSSDDLEYILLLIKDEDKFSFIVLTRPEFNQTISDKLVSDDFFKRGFKRFKMIEEILFSGEKLIYADSPDETKNLSEKIIKKRNELNEFEERFKDATIP